MSIGHFFKKRASILPGNKLQEFGVIVYHPFFPLNQFIEFAVQTGSPFVSKGPLSTPATKCARNRPTDSTTALAGIYSIIGGIGSRWAYSKFRHLVSVWLSSAFHVFPAILSVACHFYRLLFDVKIWHRGNLSIELMLIKKIH
jgi:hypothetical protein